MSVMLSATQATEIAVAVACLLLAWTIGWRYTKRKYPPGPPSIPFFGNMHALPSTLRWEAMDKFSKQYGDLVFFHDRTTKILALNSYEAVHDLLEARAPNYSDRPQSQVLSLWKEHAEPGFGLINYGPEWALERKIFVQKLNRHAVREYWDVIDHEGRVYVDSILREPVDPVRRIRLMAARLILKVAYGITIDTMEDPFVTMPELVVSNIGQALIPKTWAIDSYPILRYLPEWLPGMGFKGKIRLWGQTMREMNRRPWALVKEQIKAGTAKSSIAWHLMESKPHEDEDALQRIAGAMYTAGADTTTTTLWCFYLAMAAFPEAQKKAQEEIDRVVGSDRLPTLEDRERLPYVNGVVQETWRRFIIAPLALQHVAAEDDVYCGYVIPKGTHVYGNGYAISQNPDIYPDLQAFKPERWMVPEDQMPLDTRKYVFGFGRRICPGADFATLSVWSTVATMLATMNIKRALDKDGKEIMPDLEPDPIGPKRPKLYDYVVEPRSVASKTLLASSVASGED